MMKYRAHFGPFPIRSGEVGAAMITNAMVTVCKPGTSTPIPDPIYGVGSGGSPLPNPFNPPDGNFDVYVDTPQTVDFLIQASGAQDRHIYNIDIGVVDVPGRTSLYRYGIRMDGTDETDRIQAAWDDLEEGDTLYHPGGGQVMVSEMLQLPIPPNITLDAPIGGQLGLPPFSIRAMAGSSLPAIAATREWINNGGVNDTGRLTLRGLGFDGGNYRAGDSHKTDPPESGAYTNHGLVIHGTGNQLESIFVLSTNGDGILIPGVGQDELTVLSGSHENRIVAGSARFTGGSGLHAGEGQQDTWVHDWRPSFNGLHGTWIEACAGWTFVKCHPTFARGDAFRTEGGWPATFMGCYITLVGEYNDNTGYPDKHYAFHCKNGAILIGNKINFNPDAPQVDPTAGYYFENGPVIYIGNNLMANPDSNATEYDRVSVPDGKWIELGNYVEID